MNPVFALHVWWGDRWDEGTKQGFTRSTEDNHNTLRLGPLHIAFGIEGRL